MKDKATFLRTLIFLELVRCSHGFGHFLRCSTEVSRLFIRSPFSHTALTLLSAGAVRHLHPCHGPHAQAGKVSTFPQHSPVSPGVHTASSMGAHSPEWGGHRQLWPPSMKLCCANRCDNVHCLGQAISCGNGMSRYASFPSTMMPNSSLLFWPWQEL